MLGILFAGSRFRRVVCCALILWIQDLNFAHTIYRLVYKLPPVVIQVTALAFSTSDLLLSGSADNTVKLWQEEGDSWALKSTLRDFDDYIVRICVHPISKYSITVSANATWHLHDLETPKCIVKAHDADAVGQFTCGNVHPDGALVGLGTSSGAVRIWDIKESKFIMAFTEGMEGLIYDMAFNENGYWLATGCDKGVQIWDLRKLRVAVEMSPFEKGHAACLSWDQSGKYLVCFLP